MSFWKISVSRDSIFLTPDLYDETMSAYPDDGFIVRYSNYLKFAHGQNDDHIKLERLIEENTYHFRPSAKCCVSGDYLFAMDTRQGSIAMFSSQDNYSRIIWFINIWKSNFSQPMAFAVFTTLTHQSGCFPATNVYKIAVAYTCGEVCIFHISIPIIVAIPSKPSHHHQSVPSKPSHHHQSVPSKPSHHHQSVPSKPSQLDAICISKFKIPLDFMNPLQLFTHHSTLFVYFFKDFDYHLWSFEINGKSPVQTDFDISLGDGVSTSLIEISKLGFIYIAGYLQKTTPQTSRSKLGIFVYSLNGSHLRTIDSHICIGQLIDFAMDDQGRLVLLERDQLRILE
jgi:hypothetical protein